MIHLRDAPLGHCRGDLRSTEQVLDPVRFILNVLAGWFNHSNRTSTAISRKSPAPRPGLIVIYCRTPALRQGYYACPRPGAEACNPGLQAKIFSATLP